MRHTLTTLCLCLTLTGCGDESCALQYSDVEPAHRCEAIRCASPDRIINSSQTERVENEDYDGFCTDGANCEEEQWYSFRANYAECIWDCVELGNGARARVVQAYRKAPGECIELVDETLDRSRAACDRECETVQD